MCQNIWYVKPNILYVDVVELDEIICMYQPKSKETKFVGPLSRHTLHPESKKVPLYTLLECTKRKS